MRKTRVLFASLLLAASCSHLDEVDKVDPKKANPEGTCMVTLTAPSEPVVAKDDVDQNKEGIQLNLSADLTGTNCKEVRLRNCDAEGEKRASVDPKGESKTLSITLNPDGATRVCVTALDGRNKPQEVTATISYLTCDASQQLCESERVCADLQSDAAHCGRCGNSCPNVAGATAVCSQGQCGAQCEKAQHYDPVTAQGELACQPRAGCDGLSSACKGADCCAWDRIAEGNEAIRYQRGYDASDDSSALGSEWQPRNDKARVVIQPFYLDRFEVSVSRFRKFVANYDNFNRDESLRGGRAQHPALGPDSGFKSGWKALSLSDSNLKATVPVIPTSAEDLVKRVTSCGNHTYSADAGDNEARPINCLTFFEAFLFCMWDQGRLPTEAEWQAAASSGSQRVYPWSDPAQNTNITRDHAVFNRSEQLPEEVGERAAGAGKYGSRDLAGNVYEWVRDSEFDDTLCTPPTGVCNYVNTPNDPLELTQDADANGQQYRVVRGGSYKFPAARLRNAHRYVLYGMTRLSDVGLRCARPVINN